MQCSQDGTILGIGDKEGIVTLYSLETFEKIIEMSAHDQEVLCIDFTQENSLKINFLATGSRDRLIHVFDGNSRFSLLTTLEDHSSSITSLKFVFIQEKLFLVSCGADKSLIFREYRPNLSSYFVKISLEVDKQKFFSMELIPKVNDILLGQEKKLQCWSIVKENQSKNIKFILLIYKIYQKKIILLNNEKIL